MDISQDGNFNLQAVDKRTGTATLITKLNSTTVGGLFGGAFAHIAARDAVFTIGLDKDLDSSDLAVVSIKDGSTLGSLHFAKQLSTNTQYDPVSELTYVVARDMTTLVNSVWAMNLSSSGQLNMGKAVTLPPKMVVELGRSAYCPVGGMLFLTTRQDDAPHGTGIIRVSMKEKKILTNEALADDVQILLWDFKKKIMYAWFATESAAGVFGTIDPSTGKTLSTIATFTDLSSNSNCGASSVLDLDSGTVYASLINMTDPSRKDGVPHFVSVDLATGAAKAIASGGEFLLNIAV